MTEGAPGSISQLVADHYAVIYRYAYRLTGCQAEAEDLCQQVFVIALEKLSQLRSAENGRGWLFAILRSVFVRQRQQFLPLREADLKLNADAFPADFPGEGPMDQERLQQALDELPEGMRVVLMMFYFEEASYREISEALALPMGTVMSRLSRAKAFLRSTLSDAGAARAAAPRREVGYG